VARWIRARSRGTTRVIVLGRKAALCTNHVDLAIAPRTARLPEDPRRIETLAPLHRLHRDVLDAAAAAHAPFGNAPRPRITLVVGGSAGRHRFGAAEARDLAAKVLALVSRSRGSLFVTTSRRTGEEASAALADALASNPSVREVHRFRTSAGANPYLALLGGADVLVVTGESESMLAEAASTGHLVFLAVLPERAPTLRRRLRENVTRVAEGSGAGRFAWFRHVAAALITRGLLLPPRNLERLHDDLVGLGIAQRLTDESTISAPTTIAPLDESSRVAAEVRKRLDG
jgi:mitochondrial fission protein ELM1